MPEEVPLLESHVIDDRSFLSLVTPAHASRIVDAFMEALEHGNSVTRIQLAAEPHRELTLHYLDVQDLYGVVLRFAVGVDSADASQSLEPSSIGPARPRLATMQKSLVSSICGIDEATTLLLGWETDEMVGHQTLEFIHPDDHARAIDNWMEFRRIGVNHAVRLRYRCRDGSWLWVETSNELRQEPGGEHSVHCQLIDISEEMAAHEALRHNEQFLRRVTETVPVGLAELAPDRSVTYCNSRLRQLLAPYEFRSLDDALAFLPGDDARRLDAAIDSVLSDGRDHDVDVRLVGGAGGDRQCQVTLRAVTDEGRILGAVVCVVDVTQLKVQAATDPLTGVHNRAAVVNVLGSALDSAGDVAVVFLDLDQFKPVNDRFGHDMGDRILADIAQALRTTVRAHDVIGRIGGDEFLVVCPDVGSAEVGLDLARRLALSVERCAAERGLRLGASAGVAWIPAGAVTTDEAIARADTAMYAAKRSRVGEPVLWDEAMADGGVVAPLSTPR